MNKLYYYNLSIEEIKKIQDAKIKPKFEITDHVISVILPVITDHYHVTSDEERIISALENGEQLSSSEIAKLTGYTKSKTLRLIDGLKEKEYIKVIGNGRGTRYTL